MNISLSFTKILILINLLSFGRYFCYVFIQTFQDTIQKELEVTSATVLELLEWYRWPNMILSVICGFLMDNLMGMKASVFTFSSIAMLGHILFIVSFHIHSFWLCAASQLLFGIGYETLFIIQITFCGRNFIYGKIYTVIGVLFSHCFMAILIGKLTLPLIFQGLGNNLLNTTVLLLIPHLISFFSAIWLSFFSDMPNDNPSESYVLKKNFNMNFLIMTLVLLFYYSPNLQFWADFQQALMYKYNSEEHITDWFFGIISVSMLIFGILLDMFGMKMTYLLVGIFCLFLSHSLITFTFINPLPIIILVGMAHAISQLLIWVFVLLILPKNEYATGMGFLQSMQNLTLAMSSHLKPMIVVRFGLFIQGIINIIGMVIAYAGALLIWYMN